MFVVENICKKYGKKTVLNDISFEVKPGEIASFVGSNGCGKTTLLQILAGAGKTDNGSITIFNHNAYKEKNVFGKYIGYVPQDNPLLNELSVKDNIDFWKSSTKNCDEALIKKLELDKIMNQKVQSLSGGMKRRLSLACAMIGKHPILILDEPTTSLDMYYRESIQSILMEFKKNNGIVLMATHDSTEILNSDLCFLFDEGKILRYNKEDIDLKTIREKLKE